MLLFMKCIWGFYMNKNISKQTINDEFNSYYFDGLNHSLMTPLNVIKGINEILLNENISNEIKEYVNNSIKACDNLELYLYRLILFSKVNSGAIETINVPFSLQNFLRDFVSFSTMSCKKNHLKFDFEIAPAVPDRVLGDNNILKQLALNLVADVTSNPEINKVFLSIKWENISKDTGNLKIVLTTDIPTSPDEDASFAYLRSLFERLSASIGGEIHLITVDGETSAHLTLPFIYDDEYEAADSAEEKINLNSFQAENARVLIVDDYETNLSIFKALLKNTLITVDTALSGKNAIELLANGNKYDLIFIDYLMPEMNGIELMNNIKVNYSEIYNSTPIFALSATTNSDIRSSFREAGFTGFIPKPVDSDILAYIIKSNLPNEKINLINNTVVKKMSEEEINKYRLFLKKYSINLDDGLHFTSNDFEQYLFIARIYVNNYSKNTNKMKMLIENNDIDAIRIYSHTVKSNSKQIGSDGLYQLASKIEERSATNNIDYLKTAEPLFFYLINECLTGLKEFIKLYDSSHNNTEATSKSTGTYTIATYKEELIFNIDNMEHGPAIDIIENVISNNLDPDNHSKLSQIADLIDEFEFGEALTIAKEL